MMKNETFAKAMDIARKKGHIKVALDFIPVSEELVPQNTVVALLVADSQHWQISEYVTVVGDWCPWIYGTITHWAKIPEIKGVR